MKRFHQFFSCFSITVALLLSCGQKDDNDPTKPNEQLPPNLVINPVRDVEGNTARTFLFTVRLTHTIAKPVTVDFSTKDGTAISGNDYTAATGKLTFEPGDTTKMVMVEITPDTLQEDDETFEVVLSNAVNANIFTANARGTILNDDGFTPLDNEGYVSAKTYDGYTLVWEEEFYGNNIDPDIWTHETGNHGWGNNESQNYTKRPENSFLYDGQLIIEARKENFGGSPYTSARMITAGKKEFKYGRIDIRAKLPEGQGIWPALWMLGSNIGIVGWPSCGEIDIMEMVGKEPATTHGTIHWNNSGSHKYIGGSKTLTNGKLIDQYHVFSIIWDKQRIIWLLDDVEFYSAFINDAEMSEFHNHFFFILNIAVGGNWPGYPDATTQFPQRMYVDYIRVFQK